MHIIEVNKLVKEYKNGVRALNELSLTVNQGEIFSLLGPNGAGKSSLINILITLYGATSGNATILGRNLFKEPAWVRTQIACAMQNISIDEHLSLMENMMLQSRLYKVDNVLAQKRIGDLIDSFGLQQYLKYPVASYSGGVKRRLDIAMNMVSMPHILFLDEPTVGMDVISRRAMWKTMQKIRDDFGTTIFLTTHYLEEADKLSDSICIMKKGKEVIQGSPNALREYLRQDMLKISFASKEEAKNCFEPLKSIIDLKESDLRHDKIITNLKKGHADLEKANRWLLEHDISFWGIEIMQPTLEDVFIRLTGEDGKEVS